jgi:hypothetical protein
MVSIDFLYLNKPVIDHGHIPDLSSNIKIPGEYCIFNRTVTQGKILENSATALRGIFCSFTEIWQQYRAANESSQPHAANCSEMGLIRQSFQFYTKKKT